MAEDAGGAELRESEASRTGAAQRRLRFVTGLYVAVKNARIFAPDNDVAVQSIKGLLASIRDVLETDALLTLGAVRNYLILNGVRVKADLTMMVCYNFVLHELERLKIGAISFAPSVEEMELGEFIYLLAGFEAPPQGPFEEFSRRLAGSAVRSVTVEREVELEEEPVSEGLAERSRETYLKTMSVAREVFTRARAGRAVSFRQAKRVVQNIIDVAMEEEHFLFALASIKNYDEYTFNHSANVCVLSIGLGQKLGLPKFLLEALGMGALLHDVGKISIPREVLNKPGKLNDEEWALMRRHPLLGVRSLLRTQSASDLLLRSVVIAFEHHQRVDSSGYPRVEEKRPQNLLSEIVAIADCYDAMTTPRVYRPVALKPPAAWQEMLRDSGTVFDPTLLRIFISTVGLYPVGSLVTLDTNELGLVHSVNPEPRFTDRPLVKVLVEPAGSLREPQTELSLTKGGPATRIVDLTEVNHATGQFKRHVVDCVPPSERFVTLDDYVNAL